MPPAADIQDLRSHARTRLAPSRKKKLSRKDLLALYKRFLKTEEHRIYLLHKGGASGLRVAGRRSDLIDVIVRNLYEDGLAEADEEGAAPTQPLAVVAAGGYGRGRLNPHSDIDLHFITPTGARKLPAAHAKLVENVLYMLYDCGFKVGHAVRSIKETIQQANEDNKTKSAIIEARLICGNRDLFEDLMAEFHKKCIAKQEKKYIDSRLNDMRSRHGKWSDTVYLQEPHVKEGCGGLRDYQNLIWVSYVKMGTTRLADLRDQKLMSVSAYRELRKGYDFLMRVRNDLHYSQKRGGDILTLRLQGVVAKHFHYPQRGILRKTEAFMRDYYEHTRNILQRSSELLDRFHLEQNGNGKQGIAGFLGKGRKPDTSIGGFVIQNDRLYAAPDLLFAKDPNKILQLFRHSQQRHLRLAPELVQKIQRHYKRINRNFRYSKTNRETFEAILSRKGEVAFTLRQMHRAGVLGRYMPEFGALTNLVQHEFFHRYTADEHTLRCIEELDKLATDESRELEVFRKLFLQLEDPFIIYLSLLLHDTGRALNTDAHDQASAELASKVCRRLSLDPRRRRMILFLVDHHLTFFKTATAKNIEDPQTIADFAVIIRDRPRLDYLFLHTFADTRGTSDEAWSDWKSSLMRRLYFSTAEYLEDKETFLKKHETDKVILRDQVEQELPADLHHAAAEHFEGLPPRYFRTQSSRRISEHIRLVEEHKASGEDRPNFFWKSRPEMGWSALSFVGRDRHGLLAIIAGALASENIDILGADLFTRSDGLALDFFRICDASFGPVKSERTQKRVEEHVCEALQGEPPDFAALIAESRKRIRKDDIEYLIPQRVYIDLHAQTDETAVELQVVDRVGLLHDVFSAISDLGLAVASARISTTCGAAIDTIHVVDGEGCRLEDEKRIKELQEAIEEAVGIDD